MHAPKKVICISALDRRKKKKQRLKKLESRIIDSSLQTPGKLKSRHSKVEQAGDEKHAEHNLQNQ